MNMHSFFNDQFFPYLMEVEKGYVNDPLGGATYAGITESLLKRVIALNSGSNIGWTVKDLEDKPELISAIYVICFWLPVHGYNLPHKTAIVMCDGSIQHNVRHMVQMLQETIGIAADGLFGQDTLAAVNTYIALHSEEKLAEALLDTRKKFYISLDSKENIHGWRNRLNILAKTFGITWFWEELDKPNATKD